MAQAGAAAPLHGVLLSAGAEYVRRAAARGAGGGVAAGGEGAAGGAPGLGGLVRLRLNGSWANVNGRGHSNVAHAHPGLLSGALYVDPGHADGATLCFEDPRPRAGAWADPAYAASPCRSVESAEGAAGSALAGLLPGDLVVFPSWLVHHVPLHAEERLRVTVAFNIEAEVLDARGPLRFEGGGELPGAPAAALELFGSPAVHLAPADGAMARAAPAEAAAEGGPAGAASGEPAGEATDEAAALRPPATPATLAALERPRRRTPPFGLAAALRRAGPDGGAPAEAHWGCLAAALAAQAGWWSPGARPPTVALLELPPGFVQPGRESHDAWRIAGVHVLAGAVRLMLFDPRPALEAVAAADVIVRRLFGGKVGLRLEAGQIAMVPGWVPTSLEVEGSAPAAVLSLHFP